MLLLRFDWVRGCLVELLLKLGHFCIGLDLVNHPDKLFGIFFEHSPAQFGCRVVRVAGVMIRKFGIPPDAGVNIGKINEAIEVIAGLH